MNEKKPLRRIDELRPFSKDHHHGLLLSWKIRTGLKKGVEKHRIAKYVQWFFAAHLQSHFRLEEEFIFPILDITDPLVMRAIEDHRSVESIVKSENPDLPQLADLLEDHIRFEERVLFEKIQQNATPNQLQKIAEIHADSPFEEHEDQFWKP